MKKHAFLLVLLLLIPLVIAREAAPSDGNMDAAGALFPLFTFFTLFMFLGMGLLILGALGFWIWMLVDCLRRDFKDKVLWILIILLASTLGAIIYFFVVYRKQPKATQPKATKGGPTKRAAPVKKKKRR